MKTLLTVSVVALGLAISGTAIAQQQQQERQQMTQAQCQNVWSQINPTGNGEATQATAGRYLQDFSEADKDGNDQISRSEFMEACEAGEVTAAATGMGTGTGTGAGTGGAGRTTQ